MNSGASKFRQFWKAGRVDPCAGVQSLAGFGRVGSPPCKICLENKQTKESFCIFHWNATNCLNDNGDHQECELPLLMQYFQGSLNCIL